MRQAAHHRYSTSITVRQIIDEIGNVYFRETIYLKSENCMALWPQRQIRGKEPMVRCRGSLRVENDARSK